MCHLNGCGIVQVIRAIKVISVTKHPVIPTRTEIELHQAH